MSMFVLLHTQRIRISSCRLAVSWSTTSEPLLLGETDNSRAKSAEFGCNHASCVIRATALRLKHRFAQINRAGRY
jgi:hypothetical protein